MLLVKTSRTEKHPSREVKMINKNYGRRISIICAFMLGMFFLLNSSRLMAQASSYNEYYVNPEDFDLPKSYQQKSSLLSITTFGDYDNENFINFEKGNYHFYWERDQSTDQPLCGGKVAVFVAAAKDISTKVALWNDFRPILLEVFEEICGKSQPMRRSVFDTDGNIGKKIDKVRRIVRIPFYLDKHWISNGEAGIGDLRSQHRIPLYAMARFDLYHHSYNTENSYGNSLATFDPLIMGSDARQGNITFINEIRYSLEQNVQHEALRKAKGEAFAKAFIMGFVDGGAFSQFQCNNYKLAALEGYGIVPWYCD